MDRTEIAILGAGLTGLSTARFLKKGGYAVFEKEPEPGGLCRTRKIKNYFFDYTGHLLHLRREETLGILEKLMPDGLDFIKRNAMVYTNGRYTPYPFQVNLKGLPDEVIKECLIGFIRIETDRDGEPGNFKEWILRNFGEGIAEHFMFPYNRKLWRRKLDEISHEWVSWSVPKPSLEEVINGTLGIKNRDFGYNPSFLYPREGGIGYLVAALEKNVSDIHTGREAVEIDAESKRIIFSGGEETVYSRLVSTLPLPALIGMISGPPDEIGEAADRLKWVNVLDINLGIRRARLNDAHWVYFPGEDIPFYRVGFPTNFCKNLAPKSCSTIYAEVSYSPDEDFDRGEAYEESLSSLVRLGVLRAPGEIEVSDLIPIEPAYVVFDEDRKKALPPIKEFLREKDIYSIGRFGAWDYLSMEDCIIQAMETAEHLNK